MQPDPRNSFGTSASHWFARGLVGGFMIVAAVNALSYFFYISSINDLINGQQQVNEAIGFPFIVWSEQGASGGLLVDYGPVGLNSLVGIAFGSVLGLIAVKSRHALNTWVDELQQSASASQINNFQFSVKSLLVLTSIVAAFIASLTHWHGTPQVLLAIYFLGPFSLIFVVMLPSKIHWQHRAILLTILAITMIGVALSSGTKLDVPMDRVLLGIFVSWTTQSVFGALSIVSLLVVNRFWLKRVKSPTPTTENESTIARV